MATYLLWDSSGFAKRYAPEKGTAIAELLFDSVEPRNHIITGSVYAETAAMIVRKKNGQVIPLYAYQTAMNSLREDVGHPVEPITLLGLDLDAFLKCVQLIQRHNINGSDAAMLHVYLEYAAGIRADGDSAFLVASDARLRRASEAEGLSVLDPEELTTARAAAILTAT